MLSCWTRAFALVALAAFIGNAQCFGTCASAACGSTKPPSKTCHRHKSSDEDTARCSHQHLEFAAPEAGFAKVAISAAIAILPALTSNSAAVALETQFLGRLDMGSPPGSLYGSRTSVLRI